MSIAARNAILAGGAALPYDAEVEYLESTGTQYIDTGIKWNSNLISTATIAATQNGIYAQTAFFGCREISEGMQGYIFGYNTSNKFVSDNSGVRSISNITCSLRVPYDISKGFSTTAISGNSQGETLTATPSAVQYGDHSIILFGAYYGLYSGILVTPCRVYAFKIDGKVDMIPVRFTNELGNTEGAMYDRVSGELFRNSGTGAFVIGPDASAANGGGGGYKRQCVRRSHTRSWRPSARFCSPRLWKEVA